MLIHRHPIHNEGDMRLSVPLLEQVKIQAKILIPLIKALQVELGEERANALVRSALGDAGCGAPALGTTKRPATRSNCLRCLRCRWVDVARPIHQWHRIRAGRATLAMKQPNFV